MSLTLDDIDRITGDRIGKFDLPCPLCGPHKSRQGQQRKVLRVWRLEDNFATFHCARCGERGYVRRDGSGSKVDQRHIEQLKAAAAARDEEYARGQAEKAAWLWGIAKRAIDSPVEDYLAGRGITCGLPKTIRYLPARKGYEHAMICAFGLVFEDADCNVAEPTTVAAVHLTILNPTGTGKADIEPNKKIVGPHAGKPIVLAPPGEGYAALAITEDVEDGLAGAQALRVAVWAAGSAGNMPKIAQHVPIFTESVTVFAHADPDGQKHAKELAGRLLARGIPEVRIEGLT